MFVGSLLLQKIRRSMSLCAPRGVQSFGPPCPLRSRCGWWRALFSRFRYLGALSGADWSIRPTAAVVLTGTEGALVQHATFDSVGGNGVLISGYARNATVADSEFGAWGTACSQTVRTTTPPCSSRRSSGVPE